MLGQARTVGSRLGRVALFALASISLAHADLMVVQKAHTDAHSMMGVERPATDQEITLWVANDRMAQIGGQMAVLVRLDQKKIYLIDPTDKTAMTIDLPIDFKQLVPPEAAGMVDQIKAMMKAEVKVTPTEETTKVGPWTAKLTKIEAKSMQMTATISQWLTDQIKFPNQAGYAEMVQSLGEISSQSWLGELAKLSGFAVRSEMTLDVMGSKIVSRNEVTAAETKPAPAGTYEVPAGYTVKPFDIAAMQQKQTQQR